MADLRLRTFFAGQFIQLNSALELATGVLSKADRTSAVKACLAEAILNLAAEGEANPIKLSETALTRVRESCSACRGCDGLSNMLQIQCLPREKSRSQLSQCLLWVNRVGLTMSP